MLKRFPDWPERLAAFLKVRTAQDFAWGSNDCGLLAADAVLEMTGVDLAVELRGKYATEQQAAEVLAPFGGLEGFAQSALSAQGAPEIGVRLAQRGDVVLLKHDEGETLGVVGTDGRFAVMVSEGRARHIPVKMCARAWRIG